MALERRGALGPHDQDRARDRGNGCGRGAREGSRRRREPGPAASAGVDHPGRRQPVGHHREDRDQWGVGDSQVIPTSVGLVAVGWASGSIDSDASVWRSADGREWTLDTADAFAGPAGSDQEMWGVTAFSGGLVAAGSDDRGGDPDAAFWLHDQDGWSEPVLLRKDGDQVVKAVVAGGGGLVAVGSTVSAGSQDAAIWISADGSKWHAVPGLAAPGSQQLTGVVAYGSGFVAVGSEGATKQLDMAVWTSRDGRTWKRSTSEEFGGPGTQFAHGALAFKGKLVVVGNEDLGGTGQAAVWIGTPVSSSATPGPSTGHTGSPADESPTP